MPVLRRFAIVPHALLTCLRCKAPATCRAEVTLRGRRKIAALLCDRCCAAQPYRRAAEARA